ncbi:MAG: ROK family protein [Alphaproteobacteria bacterium]|nr:ROK family protein [Alphaproteobacteria bacterium]
MSKDYAIGIDIGGTGTKFGIVDKMGNVIYSDSVSTTHVTSPEQLIKVIYDNLQPSIISHGGINNFVGVGLGAPNGNVYTGTVEWAPNLPWKGIIPLAKIVKSQFKIKSLLTNDANAAAIGEMQYGAAKGMKDFVMITLGTGVGSGFVVNGQLVYGHDGFAGEFGHTIIFPDGRLHQGTGIKGSLESYCSATGVRITTLEKLESTNKPSLLRAIPEDDLDAKAVYEAAKKGDAIAIEVFNTTGEILGLGLANIIMITSPEAIILFGGLAQAGDFLLKPLRKTLEAHLLPIFQNKVKILLSHLKSSDAAILGASALVWD